MAKRTLLRNLRSLPKTLDGVKLTIGRTIALPDGKVLNPGDQVPAELLGQGVSVRQLVRRGYVLTSEKVDHRFLDGAPKAEPPKQESPKEEEKKSFKDINGSSSKAEIRTALEALGFEVGQSATKKEMLLALQEELGDQ